MKKTIAVVKFTDGTTATVTPGLGVLQAVYLKHACDISVAGKKITNLATGALLATVELR